jgi:hypothetical protein
MSNMTYVIEIAILYAKYLLTITGIKYIQNRFFQVSASACDLFFSPH